jgi:FAD/FMN-containing dehydrogenase
VKTKAQHQKAFRERRTVLGGIGGAVVGAALGGPMRMAKAASASDSPSSAAPALGRAAVARGEPNYEVWRQSMIWQRRKSPRYPDLIVQADSVADVVGAVNYARSHGLRVTTRCGGHSISSSFLRERGMLIDVSRLRGVEMDPARHSVSVGPGVIARELNAHLQRAGQVFPTAHCGMVPLGGFLLGGGLGLNGNAWGGMATFNIESAEIVTADGQIRTASAKENPDLYWALRGGGPGLFGVVTRFALKTYDLPKAIVGNTLTFDFDDLESVAMALAQIAPQVDRNVELLGYVGPAPAELAAKCRTPTCRLAMYLNANAYTSSVASSRKLVAPLFDHPISRRAIASSVGRQTTTEELYFEEELGFSQRRWAGDNVFTNRPADVAAVLRKWMPRCPATDAQAVLLYKGGTHMPEAACSVIGDFYASFYMLWDNPTQDRVMMNYIRDLYAEVSPLGVGSNINEMNQEGRAEAISTCYSAEAWLRMDRLRSEWDPNRVFHDFLGRS